MLIKCVCGFVADEYSYVFIAQRMLVTNRGEQYEYYEGDEISLYVCPKCGTVKTSIGFLNG